MPVSQYELDRIARVNARKAKGKVKTKPKKTLYKSPKTYRQKALDEIEVYKLESYGKPSTGTAGPAPTATSGGSKSVRKVTSKEPNAESLVNRLRKNPIKYLK